MKFRDRNYNRILIFALFVSSPTNWIYVTLPKLIYSLVYRNTWLATRRPSLHVLRGAATFSIKKCGRNLTHSKRIFHNHSVRERVISSWIQLSATVLIHVFPDTCCSDPRSNFGCLEYLRWWSNCKFHKSHGGRDRIAPSGPQWYDLPELCGWRALWFSTGRRWGYIHCPVRFCGQEKAEDAFVMANVFELFMYGLQ